MVILLRNSIPSTDIVTRCRHSMLSVYIIPAALRKHVHLLHKVIFVLFPITPRDILCTESCAQKCLVAPLCTTTGHPPGVTRRTQSVLNRMPHRMDTGNNNGKRLKRTTVKGDATGVRQHKLHPNVCMANEPDQMRSLRDWKDAQSLLRDTHNTSGYSFTGTLGIQSRATTR